MKKLAEAAGREQADKSLQAKIVQVEEELGVMHTEHKRLLQENALLQVWSLAQLLLCLFYHLAS
jgi:hypothetical protein